MNDMTDTTEGSQVSRVSRDGCDSPGARVTTGKNYPVGEFEDDYVRHHVLMWAEAVVRQVDRVRQQRKKDRADFHNYDQELLGAPMINEVRRNFRTTQARPHWARDAQGDAGAPGPRDAVAGYGSSRQPGGAMRESWEILTAGPPDAAVSVLLLPGGSMAARSFRLVMDEPALSRVRMVATTLPGMAGAPIAEDVSIPALARRAGELAREHDCDVVVGFSHGATVALDMVLSGLFHGPVVLLGISPTTADEARFFRSVVRAAEKVGVWPMAILLRLMPLMVRSAKTTEVHRQELVEDIKMNRPRDAVRVCSEYLNYIAADRDPAAELAASGHPAWVVHAEKGDGGLTDDERGTLEAAPSVTLVTIPGAVFLLPDEVPQEIAEVIATAVAHAS